MGMGSIYQSGMWLTVELLFLALFRHNKNALKCFLKAYFSSLLFMPITLQKV